MFHQDSPTSEIDNNSFSNTLPANFNENEKLRKKILISRESPADTLESKLKIKPKSAKNKTNEKMSIRMWSAASKPNKKLTEIPIIINKKDKANLSFSNSRREKLKPEEEKKDILLEEKRNTYLKKTPEKRAQSSNNKGKMNVILPFQTSLEPEFLNLFAKGDEFNF